MTEKKRILILTADSGFGHRSAANAVLAALEEKYPLECEAVICNPLDDRRTPFYLRDAGADYDRFVRNVPDLYKLGYDLSDNEFTGLVVENVLTVGLYEIMRDTVRDMRPDVIVTTYPLFQAPLRAYLTINRHPIPLITVVTDLETVHRIWFNPAVEMCLVPTQEVQALALHNGIAPDKVHITGIPVSPVFTQMQRKKQEIRMNLGWDPLLPTFLAVGSRRVAQLVEILNVVNHFGSPLQVVAVAGKDDELYKQLQNIDWHIPVHVYEFVDNLAEFMLASDAIICKAGGLIVTEALASGLPILLIDVIPGQEEGNRDYVLKNGTGIMIETPLQMLETLAHWLAHDGRLLKEYAGHALEVGRPDSAFEAAQLIMQTAQQAPLDARTKAESRSTLIDLLTRNSIPWRDPKNRK